MLGREVSLLMLSIVGAALSASSILGVSLSGLSFLEAPLSV